jgi:integrase/recombinase XerD
MLYLGFAAGLRVSELVGLRLDEVELDGPYPSMLVRGKARKQRRLPLWKEATRALRAWLAVRGSVPTPEVFLNAHGGALTSSGFTYIVKSCAEQQPCNVPACRRSVSLLMSCGTPVR